MSSLTTAPTYGSTVVFDTFWKFAAERQRIYEKRVKGQPAPWTTDKILQDYKFTNPFRACDRVSQYLIRNVIYEPTASTDAEEIVFRILLFKLFPRGNICGTCLGFRPGKHLTSSFTRKPGTMLRSKASKFGMPRTSKIKRSSPSFRLSTNGTWRW